MVMLLSGAESELSRAIDVVALDKRYALLVNCYDMMHSRAGNC